MSTEIFGDLIAQFGFGGVTGFVVGFAVKKILKFLLVLLGIFFVALQYLAFEDYITINYGRFEKIFTSLASGFVGGFDVPSFLTTNIPFAGSFAVGLALGLKKG